MRFVRGLITNPYVQLGGPLIIVGLGGLLGSWVAFLAGMGLLIFAGIEQLRPRLRVTRDIEGLHLHLREFGSDHLPISARRPPQTEELRQRILVEDRQRPLPATPSLPPSLGGPTTSAWLHAAEVTQDLSQLVGDRLGDLPLRNSEVFAIVQILREAVDDLESLPFEQDDALAISAKSEERTDNRNWYLQLARTPDPAFDAIGMIAACRECGTETKYQTANPAYVPPCPIDPAHHVEVRSDPDFKRILMGGGPRWGIADGAIRSDETRETLTELHSRMLKLRTEAWHRYNPPGRRRP